MLDKATIFVSNIAKLKLYKKTLLEIVAPKMN